MMRILMPVLLFFAFLAPARAEGTLRWKLKKGQTLHYRTTQRQISSYEFVDGKTELFDMTTTLDITLRVRNVDSAGVAEVEKSVDRVVQYRMERGEDRAFDSNLEGDQGVGKRMAQLLRARVGVPVIVTMDPRGEIRQITLSQEALEAYRNAMVRPIPAQGADRDVINAASIVQSPPIWLPEGDVAVGDSWKFVTKLKNPRDPNGDLDRITSFRYEGTEDGLARIAGEAKFKRINGKLEPASMGSGLIRFDTSAGVLRDVETKGSFKFPEVPLIGESVSTTELHFRSELISSDVRSEPNEGKKP